jgi:hypothetical protein
MTQPTVQAIADQWLGTGLRFPNTLTTRTASAKVLEPLPAA